MKAINPETAASPGRWIRPVTETARPGPGKPPEHLDVESFAGQVLRETRKRISGLAALERELEDKIRLRWEQTEAEMRQRVALTEEELLATRKRLDGELKETRVRAEREGRGAGFREGFARGREEGYRLGFEEGRREGQREGQREGREEEGKRLESELSGAASALIDAAVELKERRDELLAGTRRDLLELAMEIAKKLVKRELRATGDVVVRNVEKAIDLIFRGGTIVVQVHPEDAPVVERALAAEPRWVEGFDAVEIRAAPDVGRGGCRILAGDGAVDMELQTQLALIEAALDSAAEEAPYAPSAPADLEVGPGQDPEDGAGDEPEAER